MYIVLSGKIDVRRRLNAKANQRYIDDKLYPHCENIKVNLANGIYGDLVLEKVFALEERNRPFIGFDSHTIFGNGGSPFTYTTAPYQPYNDGKVFVLKIKADILFSQIKIPKDSM